MQNVCKFKKFFVPLQYQNKNKISPRHHGEVRTKMKQSEVKTLEQLADYINEREDWPLEVDDIIASNGWQDLAENDWVVCLDSEGNRAELNEKGMVEVIYCDKE